MKNKYTSVEIQFIIENYPIYGSLYVANHLNRSRSSIYYKAQQLGIKYHNPNNKKNKVNFLLNDTLDSFYWMGFLAADGSFNGKAIKLCLSYKDIEHLQKLAMLLETNIRVYKLSSEFSSKNNVCEFNTYDSILVPKIMDKYDLKINKTYNPPSLELYKSFTDEQLIAFFVGFIDGDGCISKKINGGDRITIQVHPSWIYFVDFFNKLVHRYFRYIKTNNVTINMNHGKKYATVCIGKQKLIQNIVYFISKHNLPVMDRKWKGIQGEERQPYKFKNSKCKLSQPLIIDGVEFSSISNAARYFNCSTNKIVKIVQHK